jgi:hypothetical protein
VSAIVTLALGQHATYVPLIKPSLRAFGRRFDYDVVIHTESADQSRPPAWSKVKILLDALTTHQEVIWIDSDALVVDLTRDLRKDISRKTDFAWVVHHFDGQDQPNSGLVFVRNTPRVIALLNAANEQEDLIDHPWWEQAAFIRLLGYSSAIVDEGSTREPMDVNVQRLDPSWNSIRQHRGTPVRVRHFAGDAPEVRAIGMAELVLTHPGLDGVDGIEAAREEAKKLLMRTQRKIREGRQAVRESQARIDP